MDDALKNEHVTKDVKTKMASILNHDLITGRAGSTPQPTDGKQEVWDQLKDVFLNPYFAPLMAKDLSNLPKTFMYICEQDVLRDEGILYSQRLKNAGNTVELLRDGGAFHGSFGFMPKSNSSVQANLRIISFLKENL